MTAWPWLRPLLWPLAVLYGEFARTRAWLYEKGWFKQKRLRGMVVSVGNLTLGGTGKTPMVIWLAEKFLAEGKRVAILSRGYRGEQGRSDEIELMKVRLQNRVFWGVGKNRFAAGQRLEAQQAIDIFLLDDGFQHLGLARDANILLIDSSRPLRQEWLLPAGRLREPVGAARRADVIVLTRVDAEVSALRPTQDFARSPVFPASTRLLRYRKMEQDRQAFPPETELPPQPVYAFCGIGNPEAFFADAHRWGNLVAGRAAFRDHHPYSPRDLQKMEEQAKRSGARSLLTTEKDAWNLGGLRLSSLPIYYCEIELQVQDTQEFLAAIKRKIAVGQGAAA